MLKSDCRRRRGSSFAWALMGVAALAGCAQMPAGPTVPVMPAPNKPFEVFTQEDASCRSWADQSIGQPGRDPATDRFVGSTLAGAAIGALAGAALGGHRGAGAGAAFGTFVGASNGVNQSAYTAGDAQRRYDIAYQQCMYSRGNVLPVYGRGGYRYPTSSAAAMPPPPPPPR